MGAHKVSKAYTVDKWIEVWDYVGDIRFKGFVAGKSSDPCLFVFFEGTVVGKELKPGYVCLSRNYMDCVD